MVSRQAPDHPAVYPLYEPHLGWRFTVALSCPKENKRPDLIPIYMLCRFGNGRTYREWKIDAF